MIWSFRWIVLLSSFLLILGAGSSAFAMNSSPQSTHSLSLAPSGDTLILKLRTNGHVLGRFTRPEVDEQTLDNETLTRTSRSVEANGIVHSWQAKSGFVIKVHYILKSSPDRIAIQVSAKNLVATRRDLYVMCPFQIEHPSAFPHLISFTGTHQDTNFLEQPLPGEGLSTFWSTEDFNQSTPDNEMFLPVSAVSCEDGVMITGCSLSTPGTFRLHRGGRFELFHRFFLASKIDSEDKGIQTGTTFQPYEFFVGFAQKLTWSNLYADWFLKLNPQRAITTSAALAAARCIPGNRESTPQGMTPLVPVDRFLDPALSTTIAPDPAGPGYIRVSEQMPTRGDLRVDQPYGQKVLANLNDEMKDTGGVFFDLRGEGNGADPKMPWNSYPFTPIHQADRSLISGLKDGKPAKGKLILTQDPHPASPLIDLSDALAWSGSSPALRMKLTAGTKPVIASGPPTASSEMRDAMRYGLVIPALAWSKEFAPAEIFSAAIGQAIVIGGNIEQSILIFRDHDDHVFISVSLPEIQELKLNHSQLGILSDRPYTVLQWDIYDGIKILDWNIKRSEINLRRLNVKSRYTSYFILIPVDDVASAGFTSILSPNEPYVESCTEVVSGKRGISGSVDYVFQARPEVPLYVKFHLPPTWHNSQPSVTGANGITSRISGTSLDMQMIPTGETIVSFMPPTSPP